MLPKMIIAILVLSTIFLGPKATSQSLDSARLEQVQQILTKKMSDDHIPGLSVAIAVDGKIVWTQGFGLADLENDIPATPLTAYRTASIGKTITATAVMQLVEKGELELDAPIQKYCSAFPKKKWLLTTRHLLSHLGGIRHYGGSHEEQELFSTKHYNSVIEALDVFKDDTLYFEPGTTFMYSTYGYDVLGCVIEGAAGMDYMEYLSRNIFMPAKMNHTRDDDPAAIIPNRASGYMLAPDSTIRNCRMVDMSNRLAAGGFITTAEDLVRFASSVMSHNIIGKTTLDQMLTPQKTADQEIVAYGLGWGLFPGEDWYGEKEAFHGGSSPGASGVLYMLPNRHFAIAIMTNLEGVSDRTAIAAQIAKIALDL